MVKQSEAGQEAAIRGTVSKINLTELVTKDFGHVVDGSVDVRIESAYVQGGRLLSLRARAAGGPGHVDHALLAAFANSFDGAGGGQPVSGGMLAYRELA